MSPKTARLVRMVKRIAGGAPHTRRQRTAIKRDLAAMSHRERGVRQGHWRDLVQGRREQMAIIAAEGIRAIPEVTFEEPKTDPESP